MMFEGYKFQSEPEKLAVDNCDINGRPERENNMTRLYHVSGWDKLKEAEIGDSFTLIPGSQGAEGSGVYFSEQLPRFGAAEGANRNGEVTAVITINAEASLDWWRTKGSKYKKYGRSRTWHSHGKKIKCSVTNIYEMDGLRYMDCDWQFINYFELRNVNFKQF